MICEWINSFDLDRVLRHAFQYFSLFPVDNSVFMIEFLCIEHYYNHPLAHRFHIPIRFVVSEISVDLSPRQLVGGSGSRTVSHSPADVPDYGAKSRRISAWPNSW